MKNFVKIFIFILSVFFTISTKAGGFIIVSPPGTNGMVSPGFNPYTLEVKYLKVEVKITRLVAVTTVEEVFYNPSSQNLEGWFIFPVPKNSALKNFSMDINGKQAPAELLDTEKARKIYEDIVRKMKDPALLEYAESGMYKARIFPIEAGKEKKIIFTYTEILNYDDNIKEYMFPLNTEKFSAKPLNNVSFKISVQSDKKLSTLYSPTHKTDINKTDEKNAIIGFEQKNILPDIDFKLLIGETNNETGFSLVSYKESIGESGFFLANISPVFTSASEKVTPKNITFIIDVSGSMAGKKIEQAKAALNYCLSNLNKNDKFNIIRFSTSAVKLFERDANADKANIDKALDFISNFQAAGGTNMQDAFEIAFKDKLDTELLNTIIFITDGKPTIGETDNDKLLTIIGNENKFKSKIFTFGLGNDLNSHLLDKISDATNSYRSYISENEDIELRINSFFDKVNNPVLADISIKFSANSAVEEVFPLKIPDLYKGSSITILGKFKNDDKAHITLSGTVNGNKKVFEYDVNINPKTENDFIPVLWATRKVGFLLDQIRLNGKDDELIDEIKQLSLKYGIISPYTSYLIVEDEEINVASGNIPQENTVFGDFMKSEAGKQTYLNNKKEYSEIYNQSGFGSIRSSTEVQNMNDAEQVYDSRQGLSRMAYKTDKGIEENFYAGVKNIQGRAVYNSSNKWIDVYYIKNTKKVIKIQFGSDKYFDLLNSEPQINQFLCLGKNIEFVFNNKSYKIYE